MVNIYQYWYRTQYERSFLDYLKNVDYKYNKQISNWESAYYMLKEDIILNFQNNGLQLCPDEIVFEDGLDEHKLKDVILNKSLVVRLSQLHCGTCVNTLMSLLQRSNMKEVIFLIDYEDRRFLEDLKLYKITGHYLKTKFLNNVPIENMNIPYLFVSDENLVVNKIYIPHDSMTEHTLLYLKYLQEYMEKVPD